MAKNEPPFRLDSPLLAPPPSLFSPPPPPPPPVKSSTPSQNSAAKLLSIIASVCIVIILINAILVCWFCARKRRKTSLLIPESSDLVVPPNSVDHSEFSDGSLELKIGETLIRRFFYSELNTATNGFSPDELLGEGGSAKVYRGTLPMEGSLVAVKVMPYASKEGHSQFIAEISVFGQLKHKNLASLRGWGRKEDKLFLVYDYMQNGSLDQHLFSSHKLLPWNTRYDIMKGVAEGLAFLHEGWKQKIVHRDIKAANVLLDAKFIPHLGDFGLARLMEGAKVQETMTQVGTLGYIAPELALLGKANEKSDVFSFGILLLEVACGRPAIDLTPTSYTQGSNNQGNTSLPDMVWDARRMGKLLTIVDPRLGTNYDEEEMVIMLSLGLLCSHPNAEFRPSARRCCLILDVEVPLPELPSSKPIIRFT